MELNSNVIRIESIANANAKNKKINKSRHLFHTVNVIFSELQNNYSHLKSFVFVKSFVLRCCQYDDIYCIFQSQSKHTKMYSV